MTVGGAVVDGGASVCTRVPAVFNLNVAVDEQVIMPSFSLHVADSQERKILAYDLDGEGNASRERVFISDMDGSPDGLRVAENGNLYIACRGIAIYTPAGKFVRMIEFPEPPANCAFGGPDLKTLYVTARTSVYRVRIADRGSLQY